MQTFLLFAINSCEELRHGNTLQHRLCCTVSEGQRIEKRAGEREREREKREEKRCYALRRPDAEKKREKRPLALLANADSCERR